MSVYLDTVFLLKVEGYFEMANNTPRKFVAGEMILDKNINTFYFDLSVNFPRYQQNNRLIGEEGLIKYIQTEVLQGVS